jgi:hypothetical protein
VGTVLGPKLASSERINPFFFVIHKGPEEVCRIGPLSRLIRNLWYPFEAGKLTRAVMPDGICILNQKYQFG